MNKVERFEDIVAWQKAREKNRQTYQGSKRGDFARDFGLRDQIQRASVSARAKVAKGFERGGDKEFFQFLGHSKGSTGEVKSQLDLALDQTYVNEQQFQQLYGRADEVSRLVGGFRGYLQQSKVGGRKFKRPN